MNLREWLKKNNIDVLHFAVKHHMSTTSIYRYLNGKAPHRRTALRIQEITNGEVTIEELMKGDGEAGQG